MHSAVINHPGIPPNAVAVSQVDRAPPAHDRMRTHPAIVVTLVTQSDGGARTTSAAANRQPKNAALTRPDLASCLRDAKRLISGDVSSGNVAASTDHL